MAKKITLPDSDYFYKRALALNGMPTEQLMPDPIRIALDAEPPSEPGWYVANLSNFLYPDTALYRITEDELGILKRKFPNARWSRRIEIGG